MLSMALGATAQMSTWSILVIVLAIVGLFVIVPMILKLIGFGIKAIVKLLVYLLVILLISAVFIYIGDTYFGTHIWDAISQI